MRSVISIGLGILLALALGLLVVLGILAPVFTGFFGLERTGPNGPARLPDPVRRRLRVLLRRHGRGYKAPIVPGSTGARRPCGVPPLAGVNVLGSGFPGLANGGTAV